MTDRVKIWIVTAILYAMSLFMIVGVFAQDEEPCPWDDFQAGLCGQDGTVPASTPTNAPKADLSAAQIRQKIGYLLARFDNSIEELEASRFHAEDARASLTTLISYIDALEASQNAGGTSIPVPFSLVLDEDNASHDATLGLESIVFNGSNTTLRFPGDRTDYVLTRYGYQLTITGNNFGVRAYAVDNIAFDDGSVLIRVNGDLFQTF